MKFLFIDDDGEYLGSLRRVFFNNPNVVFAECHSVEDALRAIAEHSAGIIFLDHSLTESGEEGLEIVNRVKRLKIYSTTANNEVVSEYQRRGIEHIGKTDLRKLKSVITA